MNYIEYIIIRRLRDSYNDPKAINNIKRVLNKRNSEQNDKIRNAGEVFVMAEDNKDASQIYDLNDGFARGTIKQREAQLKQKEGQIKFTELADVKQDIEIQRTQQMKDHYKGMR